MKRVVSILIITVICLAFLAACQQTPEKPIVIQKDMEQMIEKAGQTPEVSQQIAAPEHYNNEFVNNLGNAAIRIDADVIMPQAEAMPVLRVEKGEITQEIMDILIRQLVHGQLYQCDADGLFDKQSIQNQIIFLQAQAAGNPELDEEAVTYSIGKLQNKIASAPDNPVAISGKFEPLNSLTDGKKLRPEYAGRIKQISGIAQSEAGYETIFTRRCEDSLQNSYVLYVREPNAAIGYSTGMGKYILPEEAYDPDSSEFNKVSHASSFTKEKIGSIPDISITEAQARELTDNVVSALGQDFMGFYSVEKVYGGSYDGLLNEYGISNPLRCVWRIRYMRTVSGVGLTYTNTECDSSEEEAQAEPWNYEYMEFYADDSGIVGFLWRSPYNTADIAVEEANIITFDEAVDVFKNMLFVKYAYDDGSRVEFTITEIRFGLSRITEQNRRDTGLLVPVWDFFGKYTQYIDQGNGKTTESVIDIPYTSLLTINAIDGSIIDRSLGY